MAMQYPLIVGGAGGIGRAIAQVLAARPEVRRVDIVDRAPLTPLDGETPGEEKIVAYRFDLESDDFAFFDRFVGRAIPMPSSSRQDSDDFRSSATSTKRTSNAPLP